MIVEVIHPRTGAVVERARVDESALPFTIGRARANGLVLDDPYVDGVHARLVAEPETGALIVEDMGSVNGVVLATGDRAARIRMHSGAELRLGRTTLRFWDPDAPVPPALRLDGGAPTLESGAPRRTAVSLLICALAFGSLGALSWLGTTARSGTNTALAAGLGFAAVAAAWAGIWAIVARVVIHRSRFVTHLTIATATLLAVMLIGTLGEWIEFIWPPGNTWAVIEGAATLGLLTTSVALHLANATTLSSARRWRAGAVASAVVLMLAGLFALADDDAFTDVPAFSEAIRPLKPSLLPTVDPEGLREVHRELREEVDEMAK